MNLVPLSIFLWAQMKKSGLELLGNEPVHGLLARCHVISELCGGWRYLREFLVVKPHDRTYMGHIIVRGTMRTPLKFSQKSMWKNDSGKFIKKANSEIK